MEQGSNAVSTIGSDHAAFVGLGHLFNRRTQIAIEGSGFDQGESGCQTLKSSLDDSLTVFVDVSDTKCFVQITVISSGVVSADIQVHNV